LGERTGFHLKGEKKKKARVDTKKGRKGGEPGVAEIRNSILNKTKEKLKRSQREGQRHKLKEKKKENVVRIESDRTNKTWKEPRLAHRNTVLDKGATWKNCRVSGKKSDSGKGGRWV